MLIKDLNEALVRILHRYIPKTVIQKSLISCGFLNDGNNNDDCLDLNEFRTVFKT
jgi:hypothetical protein